MRRKMLMRRKELGLTQEQVAKMCGMKRANYSHIERGRHEPSLEQMLAIAKALKVEPTIDFFEVECYKTDQNKRKGA